MQRACQLQPLSRQHHLGLNISRHAKLCADDSKDIIHHWQLLRSYTSEMQRHFRAADNLIINALQNYRPSHTDVASVIEKLHKSWHEISIDLQATSHSDYSQITVNQVRRLATLLYQHIRFEERELYPIVEKYLTHAELDAIYDASPDSIKRSDEKR